jgi:hypothetical protein
MEADFSGHPRRCRDKRCHHAFHSGGFVDYRVFPTIYPAIREINNPPVGGFLCVFRVREITGISFLYPFGIYV